MLAEIEVDLKAMYEGDSIKVSTKIRSRGRTFVRDEFEFDSVPPPFQLTSSSRSHAKLCVNNVTVSRDFCSGLRFIVLTFLDVAFALQVLELGAKRTSWNVRYVKDAVSD